MDEILAEIKKVPGVRDVVLTGPKLTVLGHTYQKAKAVEDLQPVLLELGLTFASASAIGEQLEELDITLSRVRIFTRKLAGSILIVLCDEGVDVAMLRMATNVAVAEIREQVGIFSLVSRNRDMNELGGKTLLEIYTTLRGNAGMEDSHA